MLFPILLLKNRLHRSNTESHLSCIYLLQAALRRDCILFCLHILFRCILSSRTDTRSRLLLYHSKTDMAYRLSFDVHSADILHCQNSNICHLYLHSLYLTLRLLYYTHICLHILFRCILSSRTDTRSRLLLYHSKTDMACRLSFDVHSADILHC